MSRYIDADNIDTRERGNNSQRTMWNEIKRIVDNAPTADVKPVVHGKWELVKVDSNDMPMCRCSICGVKRYGSSNFCFNCGADMRDAQKKEDCKLFKDNSYYIKLPCEIEAFRKIEAIYKKYPKKEFAIVQYPFQKGQPRKVVSYDICGEDLISKEPLRLFDWLPSMNFNIVEDGFFTKEEAEKALKEREQS